MDGSSSTVKATAIGAVFGAAVTAVAMVLYNRQSQTSAVPDNQETKHANQVQPIASGKSNETGGCKRAKLIRKSFVMGVYADCHKEYEKRHRPIWPELEQCLFDHGVHTYSIFLNSSSNQLFGYLECESSEELAKVAETAICKKWWAHMRVLMPSARDNSPISTDLKEVFHIEK